ncbi:hypothetical protein SLE2022_256550 [Rubroshorea leprosula]
MSSSPKHFVLLTLLGLFLTTSDARGLFHPELLHVRMFNYIGPDSELSLHCRSKDDDLGLQKIPYKVSWGFRFHSNPWGTTQFYCNFAWQDQSHWFDIFINKRDYDYDEVEAHPWYLWTIQPAGACKLNYNTNIFDICYPWNPPA